MRPLLDVGVETADMLVHEVLSRPMRERRALARYAGLTGAVDESGAQRREQGLARAGNARICRGINQLAWRFLMFHEVATSASVECLGVKFRTFALVADLASISISLRNDSRPRDRRERIVPIGTSRIAAASS